MRTTRYILLGALTVAVPAFPSAGSAQGNQIADVRQAVAGLRGEGTSHLAVRLLTQVGGPRAPAVIEAMADSLVAVARSYSQDASPRALSRAATAQAALVASARSDQGVPYDRALEKLKVIYREVPALRGGTITSVSMLPNSVEVVDFLGEVAASEDAPASSYRAIGYLLNDMGQAGLSKLRELYDADAVVHWYPRRFMDEIARNRGWGG